jgi:hypothetical protein
MYLPVFWIVIPLFSFSFAFSLQKDGKLSAGPGQKPFDVSEHIVPLEEIRHGGPPKDGIPALTGPDFVPAPEGDRFLSATDRVLGAFRKGIAKAYPVKILNWHEVVNDRVGGDAVVVSY